MIDLFNIHLIYWPIVITRENTTNKDTYGTIFRFKSARYFYDTICDIFRRILIQIVCTKKATTFLTLLTTERLWARHRTCWTLSPPVVQSQAFRGCKNLTQTFWYRFNPAAIESLIIGFHNNFILTWSIDCDGNLPNSSWKIYMGELSS